MIMTKKRAQLKATIFRSTWNILTLRQIFHNEFPKFDEDNDDDDV